MTRASFVVATLLALAPASAAAVAQDVACETLVTGDIGDRATYRGEGIRVCTPADGGSTGRANVVVDRTLVADANRCPAPDAQQEILRYYDAVTRVYVRTERNCIGPNIPGDPVPVAPSVVEVMQRLPLPPPQIHTSPRNRGLVGIETWLWWGGEDNPPPVVVGVDGWTATVQPRLTRIEWDMGNGDVVVGNGPGSEEQPSATYVYERQCDCTITVTLTWGGAVTLTHPLLPAPVVQESPGVPFTTSMSYEVDEREAVIVG